MPRSLNVRPRAGRVFLGVAVALIAVASLSAAAVRAYANASERASHTLEVRRQVLDWLAALVDAETGVRGYVASNDPVFLEPYKLAVPRERKYAASVRALLANQAI